MGGADDELEKIYSRIRELECSIVTLGEIFIIVCSPVQIHLSAVQTMPWRDVIWTR